jgi:hypothetical protein
MTDDRRTGFRFVGFASGRFPLRKSAHTPNVVAALNRVVAGKRIDCEAFWRVVADYDGERAINL